MRKITMYWRDIPSMVTFKRGRDKGKAMLPDAFQEAIDRAAMRAGKGSSDLYIQEWRSVTEEIELETVPSVAELAALAEREATRLAEEISPSSLKELVRNNGLKSA